MWLKRCGKGVERGYKLQNKQLKNRKGKIKKGFWNNRVIKSGRKIKKFL